MKIGKRLKDLRIAAGLTQEQLAKKVNLSRANVSKYESDDIEPNITTLTIFSEIFNVSVGYLLCETNDPKPPGKKANDTVDEPIFITMQSYYKELPVKDKEKMDRVLKAMFEEAFPEDKDKDNGVQK